MRASLSRSDTASHSEEAERTAAFRRLAEQTLDPSFRLANAILGNPAEAEDAVQDAFVTAWRKWASLHDTDKADAWFKRIVVNTCRDRLRSRARRRTDDISLHGSMAAPDPSASVDQRVLLEQALGRLDADDQVLIALRYDHDLVLDDIAHLIDIPIGTVKWRLNRAHQRLRAALERAGGSSR
jgi:RNA polymerase sigma-70 factor (ECF subfamily)